VKAVADRIAAKSLLLFKRKDEAIVSNLIRFHNLRHQLPFIDSNQCFAKNKRIVDGALDLSAVGSLSS